MPHTLDETTAALIRRLPKTETHLHIEGALPLELLRRVRPDEPRPPSWHEDFRFESFAHFETELLRLAGYWYLSPEAYHQAAVVVFERLVAEQNVRYVETSFASGMMQFHGIDGRATAEAIRSAAPAGLEVRVFMGIHHDGYLDSTKPWIEDALNWPDLDGFDLHGTESTPLGDWAADLWERARGEGKTTKAHAGEFAGPAFVRRVVDELGVRRVQHGVRAIEDPELVSVLADKDVTFDVCPVSNVKLAVVPGYDSHPIGDLQQAGIRYTVSTDDPIIFGSTLFDEYAMLSSELGFDHDALANTARSGFEVALVDDQVRSQWLQEVDQAASA